MISAAAQSVWAKSDRDTGDSLSLWHHMQDSAAVAGKLWDDWLPRSVRSLLRTGCGAQTDTEARTLVTWLAATHDAGKAHPLFGFQVEGLAAGMRREGLAVPTAVTPEQKIPHSALSQTLVVGWLESNHGFDRITASSFATVSGGHHGVPPGMTVLKAAREVTAGLSDDWHAVQTELLTACAGLTGAKDYFSGWKTRKLTPEAQVLLTAVVIVSDWIASNPDLFPYSDPKPADERLTEAWRRLDLASPWDAPPPVEDAEQFFAARFDLPPGATPTAMQRSVMEAAHAMTEPGVLVIEAPMGEGKTEAALAAAEILAAKWGLGGVVIALPTQATSDAMFTRFPSWVRRLPDMKPGRRTRNIYLAHSKSLLNEEFRRTFREDTVGPDSVQGIRGVYDESGSAPEINHHAAVAHQWLFGRKKGLLANFVVATIDQILFAALQSKHVVLRHLALAGKVVIIDEVHAYDAYMNQYLTQVLSWLSSYGIPVILLSATLPAATRRRLVEAYESGRPRKPVVRPEAEWSARPRRRRSEPIVQPSPLEGDPGYPLIVSSSPDGPRLTLPDAGKFTTTVRLTAIDDGLPELRRVLRGVEERGGCVGIICNTVKRAQETFDFLARTFSADELILAHSRFIAPDRMDLENRIRSLLGRDDVVCAAGNVRPHRLIVVGTQVLEQSLDVDFDLMICDFAPTDLLLQRIGRLHRRRTLEKPRPDHLKNPVCYVRGVLDWNAELPVFEGGSLAVYGSSLLMRSAAVMMSRLRGEELLELPGDISTLVQSSYSEAFVVADSWHEAFAEAEFKRLAEQERKVQEASVFLLKRPREFPSGLAIDLLERNAGNADDGAHEAAGLAKVRDTDESLEVILACRTDAVRFLPHHSVYADRVVPTDSPPENRLARALSACTVRLPPIFCRSYRISRVLDELEGEGVAAWQKSPWLKGQLVLFLDASLSATLDGVRLRYDARTGLHEEKGEESA